MINLTSKDAKMKTLEGAAVQIGADMHLPAGFLWALRSEDHWSFIIKANVFLEALLSHAITAALHNPKVAPAISRLFTRDKIKFAAALGLIGPDGLAFVKAISKARNIAAHDISALNFSFPNLFKGLDTNQRKSLVKALAYFASEEDICDRWETVQDLVLSDTKEAVWRSLLHFSGVMWWKAENAKLRTLNHLLHAVIENG